MVHLNPEGDDSGTNDCKKGRGGGEGAGVAHPIVALAGVDDVVVGTGLVAGSFIFPLFVSTSSHDSGLSIQPHLDLLAVGGLCGTLLQEGGSDLMVVSIEGVCTLRVDVRVAREALQRSSAFGCSSWLCRGFSSQTDTCQGGEGSGQNNKFHFGSFVEGDQWKNPKKNGFRNKKTR